MGRGHAHRTGNIHVILPCALHLRQKGAGLFHRTAGLCQRIKQKVARHVKGIKTVGGAELRHLHHQLCQGLGQRSIHVRAQTRHLPVYFIQKEAGHNIALLQPWQFPRQRVVEDHVLQNGIGITQRRRAWGGCRRIAAGTQCRPCLAYQLQHAGGNDLLLEHIVRRPFFERLLHQREFIESAEHYDVGRKAQGMHAVDEFQPAADGHFDICEHKVRRTPLHSLQRGLSIGVAARKLKALGRPVHHFFQRGPHQDLVVHDYCAQHGNPPSRPLPAGSVIEIQVPRPGALSTHRP